MNQIAPAPTVGGQAAPGGNAKQQSGSAAPGSNAKPVGSTSTPSLEDAIVAEKKKAEHWQRKAKEGEARSAALEERLAKLEGLAQGLSANGQPAQKPSPKTFSDLDRSALSEVVKKGLEEGNSEYLLSTVEELADRIASVKAKEAEERAQRSMEHTLNKQRVAAKINSEFGPDVQNEESDLRQRADALISQLVRSDPQLIERNPDVLYLCFAQAERELRAGDRTDLERLRKAEADALAREEVERSRQAITTKAKTDVADILSSGSPTKVKDALRLRLAKLRPPS